VICSEHFHGGISDAPTSLVAESSEDGSAAAAGL